MVNTFYVIANRNLPEWIATKSQTFYYLPEDAFSTYEQAASSIKDNPGDYGKECIVFEVRPAVVITNA